MTPETLTRIEALVTKWRWRAAGYPEPASTLVLFCADELKTALDAQRPETAGTMPPIEVGDWLTDMHEPELVDVVADADDIALWTRPDVRASILEIRKANGRIWRREGNQS